MVGKEGGENLEDKEDIPTKNSRLIGSTTICLQLGITSETDHHACDISPRLQMAVLWQV